MNFPVRLLIKFGKRREVVYARNQETLNNLLSKNSDKISVKVLVK